MKKIICILILSLTAITAFGLDSVVSNNTAITVPEGQIDLGIITPFTWGITDKVELSTYHLLDPLLQNLIIKVNWLENEGFFFSSEHQINYPTLLLRTISRSGVGGILPPDNVVPHILNFYNHGIITWELKKQLISLKAGINLSFGLTDGRFETIDYPFIYANTSAYHSGITANILLDYKAEITPRIYAMAMGECYMLTAEESYEIRQMTRLHFKLTDRFALTGGYLFVVGEYPYGLDWKIFPLVDLLFSFGG